MSGLPRAVSLAVGERVEVDGRAFIYLGGYDAGEGGAGLRLEDALSRAPVPLRMAEFETLYAEGRVRIVRSIAPAAAARAPAAVPPEGEGAAARRRRLWCLAYDTDGGSKSDVALQAFIAAAAGDLRVEGKPPSPGALRVWLRERGAPGARRSADMADRRPGTAAIRLEPLAQRILAEEADRFFDGVRLNPQAVYFAARARIAELNVKRAAEGVTPVRAPSESTVRRHLRRHLDYARAVRRYGWREGGRRFQPILGAMQVEHVLELAIIDQMRVDCAVIDDEHLINIGRPWLAVILDVRSRYPLGFHLSFEPPSVETALACVRQAVRPKPADPELNGEWVGYGVPETIMVDNAWENTGSSFRDACADAGISITYAPVATPEYKGVCERFFGTLNTMLLHRLPGGLPFTPQQRTRLNIDPEITAALPLSDLERAIRQCIVEVYGRERHKGIGSAPEAVWRKEAALHGRPYVDDLAALDVALAKLCPQERTLTRAGLTHQELTYNSPDALAGLLADLLPRQAPRAGRGGTARVKLKYHPEDLGRVYVWNPVRRSYAVLECTQPQYASGLSEHQHKILRAFARDEHLAFQSEDERCAARKRLQDLVIPAIPLAKVRDRQHARRLTSGPKVSAPAPLPAPADAIPLASMATRADGGEPHRSPAPSKRRKARPPAVRRAEAELVRPPSTLATRAIADASAFAEFFAGEGT